ncbi:MAG: phytanoyl-CoA dioxygenase family protein [Actinomycetota bacterium]|nr:phytanoyl-CoA dioxygenase family protein [Actinomycetota bacterium]
MSIAEDHPSVGWRELAPDHPEVAGLRADLEAHNGIEWLEVVDPFDTERASRIFHRDGFVVIRDVLTPDQLATMQAACSREIANILELDSARGGNRGSHRYSFGASSLTGHMSHLAEWVMLMDVAAVSAAVSAIFGSPDYFCRGGGGDFCLPGTVRYQPLHSDIGDRRMTRNPNGPGEITLGSFHDPSGAMTLRDLPCMYVAANYLMTDLTPVNGPIRQIPGTQNSRKPIPSLAEEPAWMRHSTVNPAPAGSVLLRDPRAWHGGTPNLSNETRSIPNAEFYAPWFYEPTPVSMPTELYDSLSDHGKRICRYLVPRRGEEIDTGYRTNLGGTPGGLRTDDGPRRPGAAT